MKRLIVIGILVLIVVYNYASKQLEAYYNTHVTVEQARQCEIDVQNGMPVEFCD